MHQHTLFVIDDEITIREGITAYFSDDYEVFSYANAEEALAEVTRHAPVLVLLDIGLPGMNGIEALKAFRALDPDLTVIMITAYEEVRFVIDSIRQGAWDYIVKPLQMEDLEVRIHNALETIRLRLEVRALQEEQIRKNLPCFIGESQCIQDIMEHIAKIAKSPDTPVLILGETGTGKELIASTIHYRSPHFARPFITVNCAAIPGELLESELFGYEKGAFSGAGEQGKKGLIELADKGSLFLDEVGDLSADAQAKLLRFMENGEFYKVGGTEKRHVAVRLIAATNKDIEEMVEAGSFRRDLFYRLSVVSIHLPSLSQRPEDIPLFARHFLRVFNTKFKRSLTGLREDTLQSLMRHGWKGNVREMKNMIEAGVLIAEGPELTPADLGLDSRAAAPQPEEILSLPPLSSAGVNLAALRSCLDRFYFSQAMECAAGNETRAARLLGLKHHVFRYQYKKMREESGQAE